MKMSSPFTLIRSSSSMVLNASESIWHAKFTKHFSIFCIDPYCARDNPKEISHNPLIHDLLHIRMHLMYIL